MKILAVDTSSKNCSVSIVEVDNDKNFKIIAEENNNDEKIEVSIVKSDSFDTEKWLNDIKSKNVIINVIASSTCPHCHNFNPIIEKVATDNNVKLYFIEVDKLENEKYIAHQLTDYINCFQAVTHYHVLYSTDKWSAIKLKLDTGRTHQIRVHMQAIGHPLLGDSIIHQQ